MMNFMAKLYCYDHKPVTENLESDSDSDEFHIEIKENVVEEGEDSEVVFAPKAKKRTVTITYNIDDPDEEKEKTQNKVTFENDGDDAVPKSVSELNKIVSYDDADSDSWKFVVYAFLLVPTLDLVCILYFPSVNNYLKMLIRDLDFASFRSKN